MTPERWQRIDALYHAALARPADRRAAFLTDACDGDAALRGEVESLLAQSGASAFLATPAAARAAELIETQEPAPLVGGQIGTFTIVALLGRGGMGEVYRATDSKLHRDVAIKVLPAALAHDPVRRARFEREARLLAALHHPHIATVFGVDETSGIVALVMELVEGDTLAERVDRRALSIEEALNVARQLAEALDAAHEKGIIHRDLKPTNIKLTRDGTVKVLDFGLARAVAADAESTGNVSTSLRSEPGTILGTPAYMSPEQARGQTVDKRTDIWAFGCVVYEMLTGRAPFAGDTLSDTIAAILERDVDFTALPSTTPPAVTRLLQRCLEKDARRRLRDIGDARTEIDDALTAPTGDAARRPTAKASRRERAAWVALAGVAAVSLAVAATLGVTMAGKGGLGVATAAPEVRLDVAKVGAWNSYFALSPDGSQLAFVGNGGGLWLRALRSEQAERVPGVEDGVRPFWSPDARAIGFFGPDGLKRVDLDTGLVRTLAAAPNGAGASWGSGGDIVYSPAPASPLLRVPQGGGASTPVTRLGPGQLGHRWPTFLPDGRHFLYLAVGTVEARGLYLGTLGSEETRRLMELDSQAVFAPPDAVLFMRKGELLAQRLDLERLELVGEPAQVATQVAVGAFNGLDVTASAVGTLAYRSHRGSGQLVWADRAGRRLMTVGEPQVWAGQAHMSRDGRWLGIGRTTQGNLDAWVYDLLRGTARRVTTDEARDGGALVSPDGGQIAYFSERNGVFDLFMKPFDGPGSEVTLLTSPHPKLVLDWSPDGRTLLYTVQDPATGVDIWALPLDGTRAHVVVRTPEDDGGAHFSPDGRWISYQSDESGRLEVYVQRFPDRGGRVQVSTGGASGEGVAAGWRADGNALFYVTADRKVMTVPVRVAGATIDVGTPSVLFALPPYNSFVAAAPDGQRFLLAERADDPSPTTVILNWAGVGRR